MRLYVALGAGSAVVLGGALALSSYLTGDVEAPAAPPTPPMAAAAHPTPSRAAEPPPPLAATPTPAAAPPALVQPVASAPSAAPGPASAAPAAEAEPAPGPAESPFAAEYSRELNYAEALMARPDAGVTEFASATRVFEQCLKENPANEQCQRGLQAARARYQESTGTLRPPVRAMPRLTGQRFNNPLLEPESDRVPPGKRVPPPPGH